MTKKIAYTIGLLLLVAGTFSTVYGTGTWQNAFNARYSTAGTAIGSCTFATREAVPERSTPTGRPMRTPTTTSRQSRISIPMAMATRTSAGNHCQDIPR